MRIKELRIHAGLTQAELAKKLNVSRSAVAMWENQSNEPGHDILILLSEIFKVSTDYLLNTEHASTKTIRIPVLGNVAAGIPISAIEDIEDWEELPEQMAASGDYFGLKIKGQSMEPRIMEGDTVIVRKQPDIKSGEIAIVLVNGDEATCKKVTKHASGGITLSAYNSSSFEPIFYTKEEIKKLPVTILGKVVELRGKL